MAEKRETTPNLARLGQVEGTTGQSLTPYWADNGRKTTSQWPVNAAHLANESQLKSRRPSL